MEIIIRPADLTPLQIRALARLDTTGGEDSVGRMIEEMPDHILAAAVEMIPLGLVTSELGWRDTAWFRLTKMGRIVREGGTA